MISKNLILLIIGLATLCHSKVIINIRIYNYANGGDIKSNGGKCEILSWLDDYCDPQFHVCATSTRRCDILDHFVSSSKNRRYLDHVVQKTVSLNHVLKALTVEVKVEDHDTHVADDYIARFRSHFYITQLDKDYYSSMTVSPAGLSVHLSANIRMSCQHRYYGPDCERYCRPKARNYNCNSSGNPVCLLNCGDHGSCHWKVEKNGEFYCQCNDEWTGDLCQFKNYSDCSMIKRTETCTQDYVYKYCNWTDGVYFVTCQELLAKSTRPTETATTTANLTEAVSTLNDTKSLFGSSLQHLFNSPIIIFICLGFLLCVFIMVPIVICCSIPKKNGRFVVQTNTQRNTSPVVDMTNQRQNDYAHNDLIFTSFRVKYINNSNKYCETTSNDSETNTEESSGSESDEYEVRRKLNERYEL